MVAAMSDARGQDGKGGFFERGLHWPVGLVLLFCVSASVVVTTAIIGAGPGSRMIEPEYYSRAVDWDSERARLEAADRLGWRVLPAVSPKADAAGERLVSVLLLGADEAPIEDAVVEVTCFAHARAHDRRTFGLEPMGAGSYQARGKDMGHGGLWELRISVGALDEQAMVIESVELEGSVGGSEGEG